LPDWIISGMNLAARLFRDASIALLIVLLTSCRNTRTMSESPFESRSLFHVSVVVLPAPERKEFRMNFLLNVFSRLAYRNRLTNVPVLFIMAACRKIDWQLLVYKCYALRKIVKFFVEEAFNVKQVFLWNHKKRTEQYWSYDIFRDRSVSLWDPKEANSLGRKWQEFSWIRLPESISRVVLKIQESF